MKQFIQDMKGALLAATIILFYLAVISLLHRAVPGYIAVKGGSGEEAAQREEKGVEMSGFTVTAYCPGKCCNGIWAGLTASGKSIDYYTKKRLNIAAVDPGVIPLGTRFSYGGREYLAIDIGSKIRGRSIDLLVMNHEATFDIGVRKNQSIVILTSPAPAASRSGTALSGFTLRHEATAPTSVQ
jgi:3D (Asp-Asp-Asp) domain-containing protein